MCLTGSYLLLPLLKCLCRQGLRFVTVFFYVHSIVDSKVFISSDKTIVYTQSSVLFLGQYTESHSRIFLYLAANSVFNFLNTR